MRRNNNVGLVIAGICAGAVAGIFGAGGGMVLVPLLTTLTDLSEEDIFPSSVAVILPICLVTLTATVLRGCVDISAALPYMLGSGIGGVIAGKWGQRIPVKWLHRALGIFILWGGIKYLC